MMEYPLKSLGKGLFVAESPLKRLGRGLIFAESPFKRLVRVSSSRKVPSRASGGNSPL